MGKRKYKLSGTRVGRIVKKQFHDDLFCSVVVVAGAVLVTTSLLSHISGVKAKDDQISDTIASTINLSYTDELEEKLSINLDNQYEEKIEDLCSYLYTIEQYHAAESFYQKNSCQDELINHYQDVFDTSLTLLKSKISAEKRIPIENIFIYVGKGKTVAEIYEDGVLLNSFNLKGEQFQLANSIASFQTSELDVYRKNSKLFENYMKNMKNVIIDSVKLVDQVEDYQLPEFIKFVR